MIVGSAFASERIHRIGRLFIDGLIENGEGRALVVVVGGILTVFLAGSFYANTLRTAN